MVNIDGIKNDKSLCTFPLAIWASGGYSIHEVSIIQPENMDESEYLLFKYISGTSVSNWTKNEYEIANKYFDIGDREIVHQGSDIYFNVPSDFRNDK